MGSQSQNNLHNNNNMIALLFCSLIVAAAASAEKCNTSMCHSSDPALPHTVTFAACCDGLECLPVDDSNARFCQIPEGGDCSDKKGSCVASSTCVDGVCV